MKKLCLFFIIVIIITGIDIIQAQENYRSPFIIKQINVSNFKSQNSSKIHLKVETIVNGEVSIELHANPKLKKLNEIYDRILGKYTRSKVINIEFSMNSIEDGYHFIEIGMGFKADNPQQNKVASYQAFPLYFQVKNGKVVEYSDKPASIFNSPPKILKVNEPKPAAIVKPIYGIKKSSTVEEQKIGSTYQIHVYIHGQVFYKQGSISGAFSDVNKGLPETTVRLDWDFDNDPSTGYTPYDGQNTEHVEYANTNMKGEFYFNFIFNSDVPASDYAPFIRLYGDAANEATFNGDRGFGAQWIPIGDPQNIHFLEKLKM